MQSTVSRARLQIALFALLAAVASAGLAVEVLNSILELEALAFKALPKRDV
ncbi:hypothetical protein [Sorangium sp. So ce1099]|uniref:hypothetical protein n=1 Tax=Sorangium sp. So ce1099 TaxID=3133331 RepID=UPI003F6296FB